MKRIKCFFGIHEFKYNIRHENFGYTSIHTYLSKICQECKKVKVRKIESAHLTYEQFNINTEKIAGNILKQNIVKLTLAHKEKSNDTSA